MTNEYRQPPSPGQSSTPLLSPFSAALLLFYHLGPLVVSATRFSQNNYTVVDMQVLTNYFILTFKLSIFYWDPDYIG